MQPKKKILSFSLLTIYLLMALQSAASPIPPDRLKHQHQDFETVHHEHAFHVGIFHFFGHLLEQLSQQEDLSDELITPALLLPAKETSDLENTSDPGLHFYIPTLAECDVNINGPPGFLPYLSLLQKANFSAHPLRAPPACC